MATLRRSGSKVAAPVRPAIAIEVWYRRKLQDTLRAMNDSLVLHLRSAYGRADPQIGFAHSAEDASSTVMLRRALREWGELWNQKLYGMSAKLAKQFALKNVRHVDRAMKDAFDKAGFTVQFKPTLGSIEAYRSVAAEQVNLIKSIPQQYLKDVQTSVWSSVMKGSDQHQLAKELQRNYGVADRRAALIARDQNAKAKAVMENVRRQELGITEAVWMHSHAGITPRPTHVAMNGKRYKLADGMYDSAEGKNVWPGELINCRCTSRPVIPV